MNNAFGKLMKYSCSIPCFALRPSNNSIDFISYIGKKRANGIVIHISYTNKVAVKKLHKQNTV